MSNLIKNEIAFGKSKENELFEEIKDFFKDDKLEKKIFRKLNKLKINIINELLK